MRFEIGLRDVNARIEGDGKGLLHQCAVGDENGLVLARHGDGAEGLLARRIRGQGMIGQRVFDVIEHLAVVTVIERSGRRVAKIPHETIETCVLGHPRKRREPVVRNVFRSGVRLRRDAVETADDFSVGVVDFESDFAGGRRFQVVIKDRAVGRIFCGWSLGSQRRFLIVVIADPDSWSGLKQVGVGTGYIRAGLTQGRNVVEDVNSAAVGSGDDVVAVNNEVAHVGDREIQL